MGWTCSLEGKTGNAYRSLLAGRIPSKQATWKVEKETERQHYDGRWGVGY